MTTPPLKRGAALLTDNFLNKGTAFSEAEREALGLRGLLPPRIMSMEEQLLRIVPAMRGKPTPLDQHIYLVGLHDRNITLFYRLVMDHLEELMPVLYTPTVGEACQEFGRIFRRSRGLYVTAEDAGHVREVLANWPQDDVRMIVVTDGERILGLGDLGANGMGIPIGKLTLYTACAGVSPHQCLPITIDVGTENTALRESHSYMGLRRPRLRGPAYDALLTEFIEAVQERFPKACVQFEDFGNSNAFVLLEKWRDQICTFNDDIQGTASVTLGGLLSAARLTGVPLHDMRLVFLGAGEAGIGIGDLVVNAMMQEGLSESEARQRCWFVDSKGLVVKSRTDLAHHKLPFAHDHAPTATLLETIHSIQPHALIGVSGTPSTFTTEVLQAMAGYNPRPIVMALSNPTSKAECTAREAYTDTNGTAIFASGSPFAPVSFKGKTHVPGQGNNAYIFPGVGLGVLVAESSRVTDEMFAAAARTLASMVTEDDLAMGRIYPSLSRIREVSRVIAVEVARLAFDRGLAQRERPEDIAAAVHEAMYVPEYHSLV
jgi:malate dehydrogenase (oxaloacetate-decarboxylating)(NADP+)